MKEGRKKEGRKGKYEGSTGKCHATLQRVCTAHLSLVSGRKEGIEPEKTATVPFGALQEEGE
jgi:hypothetical protein